jgi:hypothetical protein
MRLVDHSHKVSTENVIEYSKNEAQAKQLLEK